MELQQAKKKMHRLVHLDLKGAPPKISYYEKLFPFLKESGATGLLIEYEDMFPFWGELKVLASPDAYSCEEVKFLQELAAQNDLVVVPLVQTFGHLEFVLKHDRFRWLRELERYPNAICPSVAESLQLVKQLVSQVLQLHGPQSAVHIGGDEVWHLGLCSRCEEEMEAKQWTKECLFLHHITSLLKYIRAEFPLVTPIMWEDMFRQTDVLKLKASGIGDLVEPMIWHYHPTDFALPDGLWERYAAVFTKVWVATAFKGATGSSQLLPNIAHHVQNHISWLELMARNAPSFENFRGFALTGWQRYDHYAILCELLPVGLPSLTLCQQTLMFGEYNETVHMVASKLLGSNQRIDLQTYPRPRDVQRQFSFPGKEVFVAVNILANLQTRVEKLTCSEGYRGWFSPYNIKHCFANPLHVEAIFNEADELLKSIAQLRQHMESELQVIFFPSTVEEWLTEHMDPTTQLLQRVVNSAQALLLVGAKPKSDRPLIKDITMQDPS